MATIQPWEVADCAAIKPRPPRRLSEAEFIAWCDEDVKAEWINGDVITMSPATLLHVRISRLLVSLLQEFGASRKLGEALGPEFTVRLDTQRRRIPDVIFVGTDRLSRLQPGCFEGAPNLIVEVVSDDSVERDWRDKYFEYEAAGVDEYWIVDPQYQRIAPYSLGADRAYRPIAEQDGRFSSTAVPGFYLRAEWLWTEPLPNVSDLLPELLSATRAT